MNYYKTRKDDQLLQEAYETEVATQPLEESSREFDPAKFTKEMQHLTRYAYATDSGEISLSGMAFLTLKDILLKYYLNKAAKKQIVDIATRTFPHLDSASREKMREILQANVLQAEAYEIDVLSNTLEEGSRSFEPERFKKALQRAVLRYAYVGDDGRLNLNREAYGRLSSLMASYSSQSRKASINSIKQIVNSFMGNMSTDTARNVDRILNYNYDQDRDTSAQTRRERSRLAADTDTEHPDHKADMPKRSDFISTSTGEPGYYRDIGNSNDEMLHVASKKGDYDDRRNPSRLEKSEDEAAKETEVLRAKRWQYIRSLPPAERAAAEELMARKKRFAVQARLARQEDKGPLAGKTGFELDPEED